MTAPHPVRVAPDALVVLAGPSGAGKSSWARQWFRPSQIVSSDDLRAVVGEHEHDLRASSDAFDVLDAIVARRLARGLLTVVDTLGMDVDRLARWQAMAAEHRRPAHLVRFDVDAATCRRRNKARAGAVPATVLTAQLAKWVEVQDLIGAGFDSTHGPGPASVVPSRLLEPAADPAVPRRLRFGLVISSFDWTDDPAEIGPRLASVVADAERVGFDSIWVMDHFVQIPQIGREWDDMLESYTTLGFVAAATTRVGVGALVSCITYRNIAHLGKIVATLDVLSGGRARCGLGLGWYEREHVAYGYRFPPVGERYELLEDALEVLPLLWGPGSPPYQGRRFAAAETICYPRPVQARVPILVGGSGEKRTLRLAARYADACNLFGEPEVLAHKVAALARHCADFDRDPHGIEVTQLSTVLAAADRADLAERSGVVRGTARSPEAFADRALAATTDEHLDRFRRIADAGVDTVIVSLADIGIEGAVANFAPIIAAFAP